MSFTEDIDPRRSLWENYNFIKKSLIEYDNGDESEVKRIAAHIRTLLYTKNKSVSILDQLQKSDIEFYDTRVQKYAFAYNVFYGVGPDIMNLQTETLPYYSLNYGVFYKQNNTYLLRNMPLYSNTNCPFGKTKKNRFEDWWKQEIYDDLKSHTLSRELLILNVAHKEGGAHLDTNQDVNYKFFKEPQKTIYPIDGELREFTHLPVAATVAQIAFEVLRTLEDNKEYLNK